MCKVCALAEQNCAIWQNLPANVDQLLHFVDNVLDCDCKARGNATKIFLHIGAGGAPSYSPLWPMFADSLQPEINGCNLTRHKWSVFGAEPIVSIAQDAERAYRMCPNVESASIETKAIDCDDNSSRAMHTLRTVLQNDTDSVSRPSLPEWSNYLSTFNKDRNALFGVSTDEATAQQMASERVTTSVSTLSLEHFMDQWKVPRIDAVRINTQGHDWQVLKQLDLQKQTQRPFCISCHVARLAPSDREHLFQYLRSAGFVWRIYGEDIVAVDSRIVWQYWEPKDANVSRSACLDLCEATVCRNGGACRLVRLTPQNLAFFVHEGLPAAVCNLRHIAQRADYIRARVVCAHGGAWIDSDTVIVRSLDPLWQRLCAERLELLGFNTSGIWQGNHLYNGFFMAPHRSRFMQAFFAKVLQQVASVERDSTLPERNWVLFGAECMSGVSYYQCMYPFIGMLNDSGDLLGRIDVEYEFDEFVDGSRFDHLLKDERIRIIPLFHTKNQMQDINADSLCTKEGTLAQFMRLALAK